MLPEGALGAPPAPVHLPVALSSPISNEAALKLSAAKFLFQIPGGWAAAPHSVSLGGLEPQLEVNFDPGGLRLERESAWLRTDRLSQLSEES